MATAEMRSNAAPGGWGGRRGVGQRGRMSSTRRRAICEADPSEQLRRGRRRWEAPMARERPARLSPAAAGSRASVSAATGGLDALVGLRRARRSR